MKVLAYVPDLMDRSKFTGLPRDVDLVFVASPELLGQVADLLIGDLKRPGAIEAMAGQKTRKVGFISHVDDETRARAVAASIHVFARSLFFSRLVAIITNES